MTQPFAMSQHTEALHTKRCVLFVCTGNTCRSPMAAAIANDLAKKRGEEGFIALSAGLFAEEGAPMSEGAHRALEALSVHVPQHAARNVTAELVQRADVVVGLTSAHVMQLMLRYPEAAERIVALPMDVADPYGADDATYLACATQLMLCVETAFFGGKYDA